MLGIHLSDFKPLFSPFDSHGGLRQCQYALHFLDRLLVKKQGLNVNVSYYTMAQRIVTVIAGVVTGAIELVIPRLSYYLEKDKGAYVTLVNRGIESFNFFIIPLSFGLMVLGPNAILLYGSEKIYRRRYL